MHLYLRLGALLCATSHADEACLDEESSLIQEAPAKTTRRDSSAPLASLIESARGMLANGATSDVTEFANETLNELADIIIPTIQNESRADRVWVSNEHAKFAARLGVLREDSATVEQHSLAERASSDAHKSCRQEQHLFCYGGTGSDGSDVEGKRRCEMDLFVLWENWVTAEDALRESHDHIEDHFCPPDANGTLHEFRVDAVPKMDQWRTRKAAADSAEEAYDAKVPQCDEAHRALNAQTTTCDTAQTTLQNDGCTLAYTIANTLTTFHSSWAALHASYQGVTNLVYRQTEDRQKEYRTLVVVRCLLNRIRELNGRPCDETTGGVDEQMAHCETVGSTLNICDSEEGGDICQTFPEPPSTPQNCGERNFVMSDGQCLPTQQPFPCEESWETAEMSSLPEVPTSPFTAQNPGCNDYPECEVCSSALETPVLGYPTWVHPANGGLLLDHATYDQTAMTYAETNGHALQD